MDFRANNQVNEEGEKKNEDRTNGREVVKKS